MKALTVKRSGWAFKIAQFGGFPEDGVVTDKAIHHRNQLLYKLWMSDGIEHDEYQSRKQYPYRDANFCEFSRAILFGAIKGLCISLTLFLIGFLVLAGTIADIAWVVHAIIHGKFLEPSVYAVIGFAVWGLAVFFALCCLIEFARQAIVNNWPNKTGEKEVALIQEKLRKKELRQAFWGAIRNKTCFKVEIK